MKKKAVVTENKVLKPISTDEVKKIVLSLHAEDEVIPALRKLGGELTTWKESSLEHKKKLLSESQDSFTAVMYAYEVESHMGLMESFTKRFRGAAKILCQQFIEDLGCKNNFEKILAETAVIAFMRYMDASRRLNNCLDVDSYATQNKTAYMTMLSKERDRSHRQYLTTISMIKQLKAPPIEMHIKATTAFVANNQQVNAAEKESETNDVK